MNRILLYRILIVAVPTYAIAVFTEQMVYTMPMLAITMLVATHVLDGSKSTQNRVDEDGGENGGIADLTDGLDG